MKQYTRLYINKKTDVIEHIETHDTPFDRNGITPDNMKQLYTLDVIVGDVDDNIPFQRARHLIDSLEIDKKQLKYKDSSKEKRILRTRNG